MKNINDIKNSVQNEIVNFKNTPEYENTDLCTENEAKILNAYKHLFGFDIETDGDAMEYFMKATMQEIWEYHLQNIIPRFELKKVSLICTDIEDDFLNFLKENNIQYKEITEMIHCGQEVEFIGLESDLKELILNFWGDDELIEEIENITNENQI